jgi:hypothetical protein
MQANSSYLPGSRKSIKTAPEIIMLFWEALQCNKRFRAYVIDNEKALEFVIPILFYTMEYRSDAAKLGVVRMCIFAIQTLSTESAFCRSINKPFEEQDSLPTSARIQGFNGSYADYIIIVSRSFPLLRVRSDRCSQSIRSSPAAKESSTLSILL